MPNGKLLVFRKENLSSFALYLRIIGGSKEAGRTRVPLSVHFFHFHAILGKHYAK